jgi:hypothetical protein
MRPSTVAWRTEEGGEALKSGNQPWAESQPYLTVDHYIVEFEGQAVGRLVTLGEHYVFYTSDPTLLDLDGARFRDPAEGRSAIEHALATDETEPQAA